MYSCVCVCQAVHQPVFVACHNCIVLQCLLMVRYFPSKRSQSKKPTETEHVRTWAETLTLRALCWKPSCRVKYCNVYQDSSWPCFLFTLRVRFHLYFFNLFHAPSIPRLSNLDRPNKQWCVSVCVCDLSRVAPGGTPSKLTFRGVCFSLSLFLYFFHSLVITCDGVRWMSLLMWPYQLNYSPWSKSGKHRTDLSTSSKPKQTFKSKWISSRYYIIIFNYIHLSSIYLSIYLSIYIYTYQSKSDRSGGGSGVLCCKDSDMCRSNQYEKPLLCLVAFSLSIFNTVQCGTQ